MDFKINTYSKLLKALQKQGYFFSSFSQFLQKTNGKAIILRHDVDKLPVNALGFAQIEHKLGVKGTYYFRIVPESFEPKIIEKIAFLGHEIGYHYEDVDLAYKQINNSQLVTRNPEQISHLAIELFKKHLSQFRKIYPIQTISMHGSPLSKYDNKLLWKYYDYRDYEIIGEPYFDLDFSKVLYLTDTGRRWNGERVSVRDKAIGGKRKAEGVDSFEDWVVKPNPGSLTNITEKGTKFQRRYNFRLTNDIIRAAEMEELPDKMMMTFHPQRWTDKTVPWAKELVWQNAKNVAKYFLIKVRK